MFKNVKDCLPCGTMGDNIYEKPQISVLDIESQTVFMGSPEASLGGQPGEDWPL